MTNSSIKIRAKQAVESIQNVWTKKARIGIILGTGSGQIAKAISVEKELSYDAIPNFPQSTAMGHSGKLVCGTLVDQDVIAMKGRFHSYEGHAYDQITLPIHVFHQLGIGQLFITNAAGGVNPKYRSGDLMAITSHIDLMLRTNPLFRDLTNSVSETCGGQRTANRIDEAYDRRLIELAMKVGRENQFPVHCGTYAGMLGPNYETRAEYRMLRRIGGDVAGMSTIAEVAVAALYQMRVLAISVVTNVAKPDALQSTSGQEVIDAAQIAAPNLLAIAKRLVE